MKANRKTALIVLPALALSLFLGACEMYEEGHLTTSGMQVAESRFSQQLAVSEINAAYLDDLGARYSKYGDGPVELVVAYNPQSRSATAMQAGTALARLRSQFTSYGMTKIDGSILPVPGQGDDLHALVGFSTYTASAPDDCTFMGGYENTTVELSKEYKIGCTLQDQYAKQTRPKDLLGQGLEDHTSDGRRASNTVELYRTGAPNEKLGGESASGSGN